MFINVASLPNGSSPEGYMDKRENLLVVCAGNYRLIKKPILPTYRPKGRIDYQIIYIVSGTGHFYFDKSDTPEIVKAGNIVFFSPKEYNRYYFYGNDQAEYYFIHFTGASVKAYIQKYLNLQKKHTLFVGVRPEYSDIFKQIILELSLNREFSKEMSVILFQQLLVLFGRSVQLDTDTVTVVSDKDITSVIDYFQNNYQKNIIIENYLKERNLGTNSFFRKFKLYTGETPIQFLINIRLNNAKKLLETTDYSIKEIADLVGYDNSLYFSRLFRKYCNVCPREYRARYQNK